MCRETRQLSGTNVASETKKISHSSGPNLVTVRCPVLKMANPQTGGTANLSWLAQSDHPSKESVMRMFVSLRGSLRRFTVDPTVHEVCTNGKFQCIGVSF